MTKKSIVFVTGNLCTRTKGTQQPERIQKPADCLPEEGTPPGPSNQNWKEKKEGEMLHSGSVRFMTSPNFGS